MRWTPASFLVGIGLGCLPLAAANLWVASATAKPEALSPDEVGELSEEERAERLERAKQRRRQRFHQVKRDSHVESLRTTFEARQPGVVVVGSSMVRRGVSSEALTEHLGVRTDLLCHPGATSAAWYLMVKNVLVTCDPAPGMVVLVFRDDFLTRPTFRTTGRYRIRLDALSDEPDPFYDELLAQGSIPLLGRLPIEPERQDLRDGAEALARALFLPEDVDVQRVEEALDQAFRDEAKVPELLGAEQMAAEGPDFARMADFDASLEASFLPSIVELTRAADLPLVLVRFKRLRDEQPGRQPAALLAYIERLGDYLAVEGVPLIDFTDDPRLEREHWEFDDHLNEAGMAVFSRMLAEALEPHLEQAQARREFQGEAGRASRAAPNAESPAARPEGVRGDVPKKRRDRRTVEGRPGKQGRRGGGGA